MFMKLIEFVGLIKNTTTDDIPPYVLLDNITNIEVNENNIIIKTNDYTLELDLKHKGGE